MTNGKYIITPEFMKSVIIYLETRLGKELSIPRPKGWLLELIDR